MDTLRSCLFIFLCFNILVVRAQNAKAKDSTDCSVGVTTGFFSANQEFVAGRFANGISLFVNTNGKITIQLGFIIDNKMPIYFIGSHFSNSIRVEYVSYHVPLLLHYNFVQYDKLKCFITLGVFFENYSYSSYYSPPLSHINLVGGAGIDYNIFRRINLRVCPTVGLELKLGVLLSFSISFSSPTLK